VTAGVGSGAGAPPAAADPPGAGRDGCFQGAALGALVALVVATASGCGAQPRFVYDKRGVSLARLDADLHQCREESRSRVRKVVSELVKECMERLGYSARPAPPPD
jgi:hypothetical protein